MPDVMSLLAPLGSIVLAALVVVAGDAGQPMLAAAVSLVVIVFALGWPDLLDVRHARVSTSVVIAVSGLAATALAAATAASLKSMSAIAVLLAGCVLLAFAHQLLRRDGRASLVESITVTLSGQVIAVLASGWVLLTQTRVGADGLLVAAVAVGAAALVTGLPIEGTLRGWAAFVAGASVSTVVSVVLANSDLAATLLVGVGVAGVASGLGILLQAQPRSSHLPGLLGAAAGTVSAVGTVAYAVARLAGG